jgi:hypothetical protein
MGTALPRSSSGEEHRAPPNHAFSLPSALLAALISRPFPARSAGSSSCHSLSVAVAVAAAVAASPPRRPTSVHSVRLPADFRPPRSAADGRWAADRTARHAGRRTPHRRAASPCVASSPALWCVTCDGRLPSLAAFFDNWGRNGFDGDDDVRAACRGAHGHVKMGNPATANDNAVALAA